MRLSVTHETRYAYTPQVETAQHALHLQPFTSPLQTLRGHRLTVEAEGADGRPLPAPHVRRQHDVFGNAAGFFGLPAPHTGLLVRAQSVVDTHPRAPAPAGGPSWEAVREHFRFRKGYRPDGAAAFTYPSPYAIRHPDFADYARPSFAPGRPLLEAADHLMRRIHRDFAYAPDSTDIGTPARDSLALRRGVCQDFAHVMVACLRAMGQAARYCSGYLLTHPPEGQPRLVGADASHAWAAVYLPQLADGDAPAGWQDFDPTNDRQPGEDYVLLALGRDYGDVSPLRGVLQGGSRHSLDVAVTVEPLAAELIDTLSN